MLLDASLVKPTLMPVIMLEFPHGSVAPTSDPPPRYIPYKTSIPVETSICGGTGGVGVDEAVVVDVGVGFASVGDGVVEAEVDGSVDGDVVDEDVASEAHIFSKAGAGQLLGHEHFRPTLILPTQDGQGSQIMSLPSVHGFGVGLTSVGSGEDVSD